MELLPKEIESFFKSHKDIVDWEKLEKSISCQNLLSENVLIIFI